MNDVYILDSSFNVMGLIDTYISLIWRPAYNDIGDFELYVNASKDVINLLTFNRYLVRSKDITVNSLGAVTYKNVMIIKNLALTTDVENGDYFTVTGYELKSIFNQRIVWKQTNLTGSLGAGLSRLVNENAINPTDVKRIIPNLIIGNGLSELTTVISKQVTGSKLSTVISELCNTYDVGWEVYISNEVLIFDTYKGVNRSYGQSDRAYVVFSDKYDNLYNTSYELNSSEYANTALVAGEGEGVDRAFTTVNPYNTGLNRYEVFVDARDLSSNKDTEDEIPLATYLNMLSERGNEALKELSYTEGFSGEVLSNVAFIYGKDFNLGDTVTVINEYGITKNVKVISAIESEDESGLKLLPQFNI